MLHTTETDHCTHVPFPVDYRQEAHFSLPLLLLPRKEKKEHKAYDFLISAVKMWQSFARSRSGGQLAGGEKGWTAVVGDVSSSSGNMVKSPTFYK